MNRSYDIIYGQKLPPHYTNRSFYDILLHSYEHAVGWSPPFQQVFSHLDHGGLKSLKTEGNP